MFLLLIVNANANELAITNKMTQEDLTNVIKNGFEKSYYCYGFDGNTKITTKAKSFPYLVISKEDEVAPWFKEKFKKNYCACKSCKQAKYFGSSLVWLFVRIMCTYASIVWTINYIK